jgi:thiol-disulfide isomerase/thioredoxin
MKIYLTKTARLIVLFVSMASSFAFACNETDRGNEKIVEHRNIVSVESPKKPIEDTLEFRNFSELENYYRKQIYAVDVPANEKTDSLKESGFTIVRARSNSILKFMTTHGKDEESFRGIRYLAFDFNVSRRKFDSVLLLFPLQLQNSADGKSWAEWKKEKQSLNIGDRYNSRINYLVFWDTAGNKKTLAKLKTRYIILDFWASWCTPCRHYNRWMEDHMESIQRPDLSIVAISMDKNKAKWVKASREDKLSLLNFCDFEDLEGPIAKEFKLNGVPHNVILTRDGQILAYDLWKDELVEFISKLPQTL